MTDKLATKEELKAEVAKLQKEKEQLVLKLEKEQSRKGTMTGWRLHCDNKEYTGKIMGVQFTNGEAFVEDLESEPLGGMTRIKLVETLHADFGYTYEYVSDGKPVEIPVGEKEKTLLEAITRPSVKP